MNAGSTTGAIVAVGSELLRLGRRDTNGDWLSERLNRLGVEVASRTTVEDDPGAIAAAIRSATARAGVLLLTGGLGPTEDDRTRNALSAAVGRPLERDPAQIERLQGWFESHGRRYTELQAVQADRPRGAEWIDNPIGSAPGILLATDERLIAALPGVPAEMRAMFDAGVAPRLRGGDGTVLVGRSLKVGGSAESTVEARVRDLYGAEGADVTILSGGDGIELHLRVRADDRASAAGRLAALEARFRERLGDDVYGVDDATLAGVVGHALERRGATVATAESCTAGLVGAALTETAGSSAWFRGGLLVYGNDLKVSLAGVDPALLAAHGAVSAAVAEALAHGARSRCGATFGIGITGIAGPGGGSADKPVGLVHVGLAGPDGVVAWERKIIGDRGLVRRRTVSFVLDRLRRRLLEEGV